MGKTIRNVMTAVLFAVVFCCLWTVDAQAAVKDRCYTISKNGTAVYQDAQLTQQIGLIRGTDELVVEEIKGDRVKVSYISEDGESETGYVSSGAVLVSKTGKTYQSKAKIKVLRRPGGGSYGSLSIGMQVTLLGTKQGCMQIRYPAGSGYRYGFITTSQANKYILLKSATKTYYVKKNAGLPLRLGPAAKNPLLTNLAYRSKVNVYFIKNGWAYVKAAGMKGYCSSSQLSKKKPAITTAVSYAPYRGVNYKNQGLSAARVAALDKARKMVTIQWTAPCSFPSWASSSGAFNRPVAIDGSSSAKFVKGKTYTGVPYSMINNNFDDSAWKALLQQGIKKSSMTGRFGTYPVSGTARGIDCSHFVYNAIGSAVGFDKIYYQTTGMMAQGPFYKKISLRKMKPGDIFLSSGHVMLYVGKVGGQYAVFEASSVESKCAYHVYGIDYIKTYGCYKYKGFRD